MSDDKDLVRFPDGFLWGAATSSHQVEGRNDNDWARWEVDGRSKGMSGRACNHWDFVQFKEDVRLMKSLGLNSYRMSVEWSRVMPSPWIIDARALGRYKEMLVHLKEQGFTVMVNLHHFTNPVWFAESGGWENGPLDPFFHYAKTTVQILGEHVDLWATLNEPMAMAIMGWCVGDWPPGRRRSWFRAIRVVRRLARVHNLTREVLKRWTSKPIGIVHSMIHYEPATASWLDRWLMKLAERYGNQWFLNKTKNDFIGVNYYMRERWGLKSLFPPRIGPMPPTGPVSDFGWEIHPEGLYHVLMSVRRHGVPIYVTENGVADAADTLRAAFIRDHLHAVHRAVADGVPVRGYFHWSLLDNFEWAEGFSMRFGLIEVLFSSQKRKIRRSAHYYRDIATRNAIPLK